ncbi:hypothetical protein WA158_008385 [Blastocystis sp. Blastoise]
MFATKGMKPNRVPGGIDLSSDADKSTFQYIKDNKNVIYSNKTVLITFFIFFAMLIWQLYTFWISGSYAMLVGSLHLIEQIAFFVVICNSTILSKRKPTFKYTYGFERHEVLSVFTISISILFLCLFLFMESQHRLDDLNAIIHLPRFTMVISFVVLVINLNLFGPIRDRFMGKYIPNYNYNNSHFYNDEDTIHFFIDIIFMAIQKFTHSPDGLIDLCSGTITLFYIIYCTFKRAKYSCLILLQTVPQHIYTAVESYLNKISIIEGILQIKTFHIWTVAPNDYCCTIILRVHRSVDEQNILLNVHTILESVFSHICIQIEKDPELTSLTQAINTNTNNKNNI